MNFNSTRLSCFQRQYYKSNVIQIKFKLKQILEPFFEKNLIAKYEVICFNENVEIPEWKNSAVKETVCMPVPSIDRKPSAEKTNSLMSLYGTFQCLQVNTNVTMSLLYKLYT